MAAVARAVSVGAVAVGAWASGAAERARSCDAASLQGFDVIRDPSWMTPSARAGALLILKLIKDVSTQIRTP